MRGKWTAAALAASALTLAAWTHDQGAIERTATSGSAQASHAGSWRPLPPPPRPQRTYQEVQSVAVDGNVIVIAGVDYEQTDLKAARLDPTVRRWRALPPSGVWWRFGYTAISTGSEILVWGCGCGPAGKGIRAEGLSLETDGGEWNPLPDSPLAKSSGHTAVWTGREMIVWGGLAEERVRNGRGFDIRSRPVWDGAAYDPVTRGWRRLPKPPIPPRYVHTAVWTGEEMLVWGGTPKVDRYLHFGRSRRDGAAYDPQTNRWRKLPRAPIATVEPVNIDVPAALWTGEEMIVVSGLRAAAYDPESDVWRRLPAPPTRAASGGHAGADNPAPAVWTGREAVVFNLQQGRNHAAYDPVANQWRSIPKPPFPIGPQGATAVNDSVFVMNGCCGRAGAKAAIYRPPPGE